MPADLAKLTDDLANETAVLSAVLEPLDEQRWRTPTPAIGWTIFDQITHLAFFDERARCAAQTPEKFRLDLAGPARDGMIEDVAQSQRSRTGADVFAWWLAERQAFIAAAVQCDPLVRVPWYGPDMSVASMITARLMETWAHGVDVLDALSIPVVATPRLQHVAFLGARAFANSFAAQQLLVPQVSVLVSLAAPDASTWQFGSAEADEQVTGDALDFCLLVVQRRHRDDTGLVASGPATEQWLSIAQAFAGPSGEGRKRST